MNRRIAALLVLACALAAGGAGVATTAAQQPVSTASAYGVSVVVPGQAGGGAGGVTAPGPSVAASSGGFVYPGDGSVVRTGSLSTSVSATTEGDPAAQAVADVLGVSLFNGEITFDSAAARASAAAATADTAGSAVSNLVVLGQGVGASPGARYALGDWGYLVVLEGWSERGATNSRSSVTAVRVTLIAEHAGLPPGTEISIGRAEAASSIPPAPTTTAPPPAAKPKPKPAPKPAPTTTSAETTEEPPPEPPEPHRGPPFGGPTIRPVPPDISVSITAQGYVFPVYGPASFSDTYGAPRAAVTWHHGTDIFAPLGAPILAVADGTIFSVGWNNIGGYRFWLRDEEGNQFYYAHLSAYTPLAVNGRRVKAGDVIGFNGNTGDAQGTPYHLHFEIHPVALLPMGYDGVVNPYPYLLRWKRLEDVRFAASRGWAPPVPPSASAPRPGAFLLGASDISRASGLDPGALERALVAPVEAEGDGALLRSG